MKLLAINGSHQKNGGINQLLIDHLFKGAIAAGGHCETIRLSKTDIKLCGACNYCQKQSEYTCIYDNKDDFLNIVSKIKDADIIIYSTPIYLFHMSSLMKTFLDRFYSRGKGDIKTITKSHLLFHNVEKNLCNKPFVSIIISDNIEKLTTENVKRYFDAFSLFFDAPHIASLVRNGSFIFKSDSNKKKFCKKINEVLYNMELAGKNLVLNGSIPTNVKQKIRQKILPIPSLMFNVLKYLKRGRSKLLKKITEYSTAHNRSTMPAPKQASIGRGVNVYMKNG
jgi:multimeric flavodoxin WrbA